MTEISQTSPQNWQIRNKDRNSYVLSSDISSWNAGSELLPHDLMHFIVREYIVRQLNLPIKPLSNPEEILVLAIQFNDPRWIRTLRLKSLKDTVTTQKSFENDDMEFYQSFMRQYFSQHTNYLNVNQLLDLFGTCLEFFRILNLLTVQKQSNGQVSQLGWVDIVNNLAFLSKHSNKLANGGSINNNEFEKFTDHLTLDFVTLLKANQMLSRCYYIILAKLRILA